MALEENLASDAPTLSHSCLRTSWSCRLGRGVRAGSWPCSQLLLGPQGRENERWHLLLGGEAPPPGCDRREPLKEDPRPSPSSREHRSAPEQVCAQTVSKRFRDVSFQPSNPLNRRQGDRCDGRSRRPPPSLLPQRGDRQVLSFYQLGVSQPAFPSSHVCTCGSSLAHRGLPPTHCGNL